MESKLFEQVNEDIKKAMLAKDKVALDTLRGIKKEFLEAKTAKGSDGTLTDETAVKIVQKMVKQRKESAEIYTTQQRPDLADNETAQIEVLKQYLPEQMSAEALEEAIKNIIETVGALSMKDMGKVMGIANKQLSGKADGRLIAEKVKALLG